MPTKSIGFGWIAKIILNYLLNLQDNNVIGHIILLGQEKKCIFMLMPTSENIFEYKMKNLLPFQ